MAANRRAPTQAVDLTKTGSAYANDVDEEIVRLYQMAVNNLTGIGGTGNAITGACDPALTAAPVDKQQFLLVPVAANTGAVTVNPGQGGVKSLVDSAGSALASGDLAIGEPVRFYRDATADNFRMIGMTRAQISRLITSIVGSSIPLVRLADYRVDPGSPVVGESFVELLFTAGAYNKIAFKIEGLSPNAANSQVLAVTLRNSGGAVVTLQSPSGTFSNAGHIGTFQGEFLLDNISATGQYHGWLEGASNGLVRARTTAQGTVADSSKPDRIRFALASTNIDAGRFTVDGQPVPD